MKSIHLFTVIEPFSWNKSEFRLITVPDLNDTYCTLLFHFVLLQFLISYHNQILCLWSFSTLFSFRFRERCDAFKVSLFQTVFFYDYVEQPICWQWIECSLLSKTISIESLSKFKNMTNKRNSYKSYWILQASVFDLD